MASKPARARLLGAILSLVLPVTFGHTTACLIAALALFAAIHFVMKNSALCILLFCTILQDLELRSSTGRSGYRKH